MYIYVYILYDDDDGGFAVLAPIHASASALCVRSSCTIYYCVLLLLLLLFREKTLIAMAVRML